MSKKEYKRILDYFFHIPEMSDSLRESFEQWLALHEGEPVVEELLLEMWNKHESSGDIDADLKGLIRLEAAIAAKTAGTTIPRRRTVLRRIATITGIAAALALFFVGGYFLASNRTQPEQEITFITARGHMGEFTLPDGSKVWLNSESHLSYNADSFMEKRSVSIRGEAFFEVQKDSEHPFTVVMNDINVEVLGTSFDAINYSRDASQTVVLKIGSVKVTSNRIPTPVTLSPGDKLNFEMTTGRATIEKVNVQNYCQWFSHSLTFDNTPFRDIVVNLERRYNVRISIPSTLPMDRCLSLVIGNESIEDILEVLSSLMSFDYRIDGDWVTIK